MIRLTRLNGEHVAINPDRIERADITPDVVLTMTDGSKFVVAETLDELIDRVRLFRASVLALSHQLVFEDDQDAEDGHLRIVRGAASGPVVDRHELHDHAAATRRQPTLRAVAATAEPPVADAPAVAAPPPGAEPEPDPALRP